MHRAKAMASSAVVGKPGELGFFTGWGSNGTGPNRAGATLHIVLLMA
jgi:hypothetical protein